MSLPSSLEQRIGGNRLFAPRIPSSVNLARPTGDLSAFAVPDRVRGLRPGAFRKSSRRLRLLLRRSRSPRFLPESASPDKPTLPPVSTEGDESCSAEAGTSAFAEPCIACQTGDSSPMSFEPASRGSRHGALVRFRSNVIFLHDRKCSLPIPYWATN